jgi:hypothetical protein
MSIPKNIDEVIRRGSISALNEAWNSRGTNGLIYSVYLTTTPSHEGRIDILDWLWDHRNDVVNIGSDGSINFFDLKYSNRAVDNAALAGHLDVIKWWWDRRKSHPFKYESAINLASDYGHVHVLNWFFEHRHQIDFKFDSMSTLSQVSCYGRTNVLDWWFDHREFFDLEYDWGPMDMATSYGCINVLDWWYDHKDVWKLVIPDLDGAGLRGQTESLKWWLSHRNEFELKYSNRMINWASEYGYVDFLQEVLDSGLEFKSDHYAIENAIRKDNIQSLDWWLKNKSKVWIPLNNGYEVAVHEKCDKAIEWFKTNGESALKVQIICRIKFNNQDTMQCKLFYNKPNYNQFIGYNTHT